MQKKNEDISKKLAYALIDILDKYNLSVTEVLGILDVHKKMKTKDFV